MKKIALTAALLVALPGCGGLGGLMPKLALTPVDIETTVADEVHVEDDEDNLAKLEVSENHETRNEIVADRVEQIQNHIQEYPLWLVIAFALSLPSLPGAVSSYWERRRLVRGYESRIEDLKSSLITYGMKPVENLDLGDEQLRS